MPKPHVVAWCLGLCIGLLHVANIVRLVVHSQTGRGSMGGLFPLFDIDREANLPAFYSVATLLMASILSGVVAAHERQRQQKFWKHWLGIALAFAWIAVDEACQIHELSIPVGGMIANRGIFLFAWIIPAAVILGILTVLYFKMILSFPSWFRILAVSSAAIFLCGAMGLEMYGGLVYDGNGPVLKYQLICALEELLEMAGVAVWIYALLRYLAFKQARFDLSFQEAG